MTHYELIIIDGIKNGLSDERIMLNAIHAYNVHYLSIHDKVCMYKDINDFRVKIAQGKNIATGFVRWKLD
jgi:hypothetical protein